MDPLHSAAFHGQTETAEILMVAGADPNGRDVSCNRPLHLAVQSPFPEATPVVMQQLMGAGARVDALNIYDETPLHTAAGLIFTAAAERVQLLLDAGAAPNARDVYDQTPLHRVARANSRAQEQTSEVLRALIQAGAEANVSDNQGKTPLSEALFWGSEEIARILREAGATGWKGQP